MEVWWGKDGGEMAVRWRWGGGAVKVGGVGVGGGVEVKLGWGGGEMERRPTPTHGRRPPPCGRHASTTGLLRRVGRGDGGLFEWRFLWRKGGGRELRPSRSGAAPRKLCRIGTGLGAQGRP